MFGKGLRLYKREKLCSVTAIERLFAVRCSKGRSVVDPWGEVRVAISYPLRMVYGENPHRNGPPTQFLVSIPKKRLRRAVDRVTMRRRVREAYRLVRGDIENINDDAPKFDVAFVYVANELVDFSRVHKSMLKLMRILRNEGDEE